jgi:hypothetical protein
MIQRLVSLLTAFLLAGCTIPDKVQILNNSRTGVLITACGKSERLGDGLDMELVAHCVLPLRIESAYGTWTYWKPIAGAEVPELTERTYGGHVVKLQLERNGELMLLPRSVTRATTPAVETQPRAVLRPE